MSAPDPEAESFLQRWSRRKQAAATPERDQDAAPDAAPTEASGPPGNSTAAPSDPPAFDPKTLPPVESITAESDIRAFLSPGVPVELSRAALRRAWTSDPAIRDFIGLAENQWDFTKPDSVPGFGSLEWTPELRRLAAEWLGDLPEELSPEPPPSGQVSTQIAETAAELPSPIPPSAIGDDVGQDQPVVQAGIDAAAHTDQVDHDASGDQAVRPRHGGALPR